MARHHLSPRLDTLDVLLRSCGLALDLVERPGLGVDRTPIRGDRENFDRLAETLRTLHARLRGAQADVPVVLESRTLAVGDHFTFVTDAGPMDVLGTPAGTDGFADLDGSATDENLDGLLVRVASLDDLIRMKRAAGRPQDRIAVEWLSALRDELEG